MTVAAPRGAWTLEAFVDASVESEWRYRLIHWEDGKAHPLEYQTPGKSMSAIAAVPSTSVWIVGARLNSEGNRLLGPLIIH